MPEISNKNFEFFFVAYLDILGFSKMVESDIQNPYNSHLFFPKLFDVFKEIQSNYDGENNLQVIQFSDSVVFAIPYEKENFSRFVKTVGEFQYNLFSQGLLCRGGLSFGKHFYKDGFLFSNGLIEAYKIESNLSRYPRIVISNDLLDSLFPHGFESEHQIVKENDNTYFIDFIPNNNLQKSAEYLYEILSKNSSSDASVNEKHRWLCEYFDYKIKTTNEEIDIFSTPRFSS